MREYEFEKMDEYRQAEMWLPRYEHRLNSELEKVNEQRRILGLNEVEIKEVENENS